MATELKGADSKERFIPYDYTADVGILPNQSCWNCPKKVVAIIACYAISFGAGFGSMENSNPQVKIAGLVTAIFFATVGSCATLQMLSKYLKEKCRKPPRPMQIIT